MEPDGAIGTTGRLKVRGRAADDHRVNSAPGAAPTWAVDDAERARRRRTVERMRRRVESPRRPVRAVLTAPVRAPAEEVWAALTDPDRFASALPYPLVFACTVPGTPVGAVGELSCAAMVLPDGTVSTQVSETLLREEGRRIVERSRTLPLEHLSECVLRPDGPDRCTLRIISTLVAPTGSGWLFRGTMRYSAHNVHWQLRRLTGDPTATEPRPAPPRREQRRVRRLEVAAARLAAGPRELVEVVRALDVAVPAEQAWAAVASTGSPVVERGDPVAFVFPPEGAPHLRLALPRHPVNDLDPLVEEVVETTGTRLVTRDLAPAGPRAEVLLTPTPEGCRLQARLSQETLPPDAGPTGDRLARRAEAYLDRLGRALTGLPPLPLEEGWVG